jgi:hypothetical protein
LRLVASGELSSVPCHEKQRGVIERCPLFFVIVDLSGKACRTVGSLKGVIRIMPGKKHVRGVGTKEQRQYEHIKKEALKSGRYGKRASEVAARTVLKYHVEKGHKKNQ